MAKILEVDDNGELIVPKDVLGSARPHTKYAVDTNGSLIVLHALDNQKPFWSTAGADEWIASFQSWIAQARPPAPILPDEALTRESIYD